MKKRLLSAAFAALFVGSAFAFSNGDYVTNATQRFKIQSENLVTNGNFADARDGYFGEDKEVSASADVWSVLESAGPNGENVLESVGTGSPLCRDFNLNPGTYVVTLDIKSPAAINTSITSGGTNYVDFFLNTDGQFTHNASTDDAPVANVASSVYLPAEEWKTVVFFTTVDEGQTLVMRLENLTPAVEGTSAGVQVTNIGIYEATEVYDVRIIQNRIAAAKELMEVPDFNVDAAQDAKAELAGIIEYIEGAIAEGALDDASEAQGMLEAFEIEGLEPFLAVTSVNLQSIIPGLDIASLANWGRGANYSANYKLNLQGGNWGHLNTEQDVLRSAIQNGYAHTATYNAYHEDLPAGKYFFTAEIRNANTGKTSWPTEPVFNLETTCKYFIGEDSIEVGPIAGEDFQRFYIIGEVTEDGQFRAGVEWPGVSSGGAFFIRNTSVRAFNLDVVADVEHIQAFKSYMTQWNAATSGRKNVSDKVGDPNYPWDQSVLTEAKAALDPVYDAQAAKGWSTADGTDAGIASTDELNEWALYQGYDEYSEPDADGNTSRLEYQLVRRYQAANNTVVATNQVITDLANAIEAAKKTRNQGSNLTGDRDTYKTAILAALEQLQSIRSTTTDATRVADSTALEAVRVQLAAATETFLASVVIKPFVDIDFTDAAFLENTLAGETDEEGNYLGPQEAYYIPGTAGSMYFSTYDEDNNSATNYALGYGEEYLDVLRVGNGSATVYIDEANQPSETDAVRVTFDIYYGNLSGRNTGIELRNAANERVAGFSLNRYNGSLAYNDFNDVLSNGGTGMNLLQYVTGVGSSSASNAAIVAESNRSSFDLVIDYKNQTLQGTIVNAKNGTNEGAAQPFRTDVADQKIVKFVLISNYNNKDRRCWFDNLKISKYALADVEEDITESAFADWTPTGIQNVNAEVATMSGVYTLTGAKVNASSLKKGLYIVNGRKVVIK